MSRSLPILHVSRLVDGSEDPGRGELTRQQLADLGESLSEAGMQTPGAPGLMAGWIGLEGLETTGLFATEETRLEQLSWWCRQLGWRGFASILMCRPANLESSDGLVASDLPLLTGHGIVLASRGLSGDPLVGMELSRLRRELEESRRRLSEVAGYEVRLLAPEPTVTGRTIDGLVRREAKRCGYRLLLRPGDVADVEAIEPGAPLAYRTRQPGESVRDLSDWFLDRRLARRSAALRRLAGKPGEIFDRLAPKF